MNSVRRVLMAAVLGVTALAVVPQASPTPVSAATCTLCAGGEYQTLVSPVRVFSSAYSSYDVAPFGKKALATGNGAAFTLDLLGLATPTFRNKWLPAQVASPSDVLGVVVSITVVQPTQSGNLTAYAAGSPKPVASNLNFLAGRTVSNLVLVRTSTSGKLTLSLVGKAAGTAHVTVDVFGWFSTSSYTKGTPADTTDERGARLVGITPRRLVDTRNGTAADTPIGAGGARTVKVAGAPALGTTTPAVVPANAVAVVLNVTAVTPSSTTVLSVQPTALAAGKVPATANLNVRAGTIQANLVFSRIGADGTVRIYNRAGATNVVVDVMGYFVTGAAETTRAGRVVPLTVPFRSFDTRQAAFGKVPLGPGQAEDWSFAAFANSVNIGGAPLGKQTALLGNLTNASLARESSAVPVKSYLTVYPTPATTGAKPPTISNLNSVEGAAVPNMALVTFSSKQTVRVFNIKGYAHYLLDVYAVVLGD
jgi:hypothetical protein